MKAYLLPACLLLLLIPAALAGPEGDAEADAEAGRQYARKQLIQHARRVAGEGTIQLGALDAMRRTLSDDINFLTAAEAKDDEERALLDVLQATVEERILLLGAPMQDEPPTAEESPVETAESDRGTTSEGADEDVPSSPNGEEAEQPGDQLEGGAGEAVRLLRWLRGEAQCGASVATVRGDVVLSNPKPRRYRFNPLARPGDSPGKPKPSDADAGTEKTPAEESPAKDDRSATDKGPGQATEAKPSEGTEAPSKESADPDAQSGTPAAPAPPPRKPLSPSEWAREVVKASEKTLLDKQVRPEKCSVVRNLLELHGRPVTYLGRDGRGLRRRALASAEPFAYNLPYLRIRELQAQDRQLAISAESTAGGLIDESLVREKTRRALHYRDLADRIHTERDRLLAVLDSMTSDMDAWREQAAMLSGRIQTEKRRLDSALTPEEREAGKEPEDSLVLRVMEAQEAVVSLDLRLFFHTVLRAEYRLELVREHQMIAEMVAQTAEAKRDEFGRALDYVRNERQMDRLRGDAHRMRKGIEREEARKAASDSEVPALRITAYESMIHVNGVVQDAVTRRRMASAPRLAQQSEDAGDLAPPATKQEDPSEAAATAAADTTGLAEDDPRRKLSAIARNPFLHTWSLSTVYALGAELQDASLQDAFDAPLIAEHYEAAGRQIEGLARALQTTMGDEEIQVRFDTGYAKANAALAPLHERRDVLESTWLGPSLDTLKTDFDHSLTALAKRRAEHQEHLAALRNYQASLLELGPLSLAVRTNTDLDTKELWQATKDAMSGLKEVQHFLDPKNEHGILGYAATYWPVALGVLALLVGILFGVRGLRRRMDTWLDREAARIPELRWTGASVRQERRHALERKRREDDAARAATEEARIQATAPPEVISEFEEAVPEAGEEDPADEDGDDTSDGEAKDKPRAPSAPASSVAPSAASSTSEEAAR